MAHPPAAQGAALALTLEEGRNHVPTVLTKQEHRASELGRSHGVSLRTLVGAGDRIALFALPVVVVGVALNVLYPSVFAVGGPPTPLRAVSKPTQRGVGVRGAADFVAWRRNG